jgi:hypothetical protein
VQYTVTATCADAATRDRYLHWLLTRHVDMVLATRLPTSARVVSLQSDAAPLRVQSIYIFPSQEALETYTQHHAPALRAEGLALFANTITFERSTAAVQKEWLPSPPSA